MYKVSIIIPIWNSVDRIGRCLDSILNQTLNEIEVICVLDCPSDGTDIIVQQYAERDERIKIIKNEYNLHVAESRNKGIQMATGEYIGFCDHDDYCDLHMFYDLYTEANKTNADVVASNATIINFNKRLEVWNFTDFSKESIITSIIQPMESKRQIQKVSHCIWHSIYKNSFLKDNHIYFPDRKEYMDEDRLFNLQVYLKAKTIANVNNHYYTWDKHLDSASNSDSYDMAARAVNRLSLIKKLMEEACLLEKYSPIIHQLISFDLQTHLPSYKQMDENYTKKFVLLMKELNYSILNSRFELGIISRKRLRIYSYLTKLSRLEFKG